MEGQIKIHEAALVAITQWTTAPWTPIPRALASDSFPIKTCLRFIGTTCSEIEVKIGTNKATLPANPAMKVEKGDALDGGDMNAVMADDIHVGADSLQIFPTLSGEDVPRKKHKTTHESSHNAF